MLAKGMVVKPRHLCAAGGLAGRQVHNPVIPLEDIYPGETETCAYTKPCIQMLAPGLFAELNHAIGSLPGLVVRECVAPHTLEMVLGDKNRPHYRLVQ